MIDIERSSVSDVNAKGQERPSRVHFSKFLDGHEYCLKTLKAPLPFQPKLLAAVAAGAAADAALERPAALGNGQLARRLLDFLLLFRFVSGFFGLGDGGF